MVEIVIFRSVSLEAEYIVGRTFARYLQITDIMKDQDIHWQTGHVSEPLLLKANEGRYGNVLSEIPPEVCVGALVKTGSSTFQHA